MSETTSKQWRPEFVYNLPTIDQEIAGFSKNCGCETKILSSDFNGTVDNGGHIVRHFISDVTPDSTSYPDTYAPIGSTHLKLTVSSGNVTAAAYYRKTAANTWSLLEGSSVVETIPATQTSAYAALNTDSLVKLDSSAGIFTVTLPTAASSTGRKIIFKMVGTGTNIVTIDGNGAETIDGAASNTSLNAQYESLTVMSDGTAWHIIAAT